LLGIVNNSKPDASKLVPAIFYGPQQQQNSMEKIHTNYLKAQNQIWQLQSRSY